MVSIIVPVYNVEKYLQRCVDSLINQTYQIIEIILVDDGSTDESGTLCDSFAEQDNRILVVHKENGGVSEARNAGIDVANGDYICFIDSDDYAETTWVEVLLDNLNKNNSDIVICGYYADFCDEDENVIKSETHIPTNGNYQRQRDSLDWNAEISGLVGYPWNKLYRKNIINGSRFPKSISLYEDVLFNGPLLAESERISFIDIPLIHYMQRSQKTLGTAFYSDGFELKIAAINARIKFMQAWDIAAETINSFRSASVIAAYKSSIRAVCCTTKQSHKTIKVYIKTLMQKPEILELSSDKNLKLDQFDQLLLFMAKKQLSSMTYLIFSLKKILSSLGG